VNKDSVDNISDQELLDRYYREQDNKWLGVLLERYTVLLFGVCMKYLKNEERAKDAVQQVFLKVITELKKYKVDYFKSWLYMVARNHCLMQLRDKTGSRTKELNENLVLEAEIGSRASISNTTVSCPAWSRLLKSSPPNKKDV
jgi:RNA polymerase sigma-70 factor (ECF subfamily)